LWWLLVLRILWILSNFGSFGARKQIDNQTNPTKDKHEDKPGPLLEASQTNQRTNPGNHEWHPRECEKDGASKKQCRITNACYIILIGRGIVNRSATNITGNDQTDASNEENDADDDENINRFFG